MNLEKAKKALIEFQKKHESYLDAAKQYREYKSLPLWKKWFASKVEKPRKDYQYDVFTICCNWHLSIELRMYFSGSNKEITLAVNEDYKGYKLNVDTLEKSYYLGRVDPNISEETENLLYSIRDKLAPLIVE